jgi:hypothetical protein
MISEFLGFDEMQVLGNFTGKQLALIPFATGIAILFYYYVVQRPGEVKEQHVVTM